MFDVLIEGAAVADGSGGPLRSVPVGILDGHLRVGSELAGMAAHRRIDASGLVLSPGFVDVHTHFDAQVFWDPYLTPSSLHGVTTVVAGNCGFSIAPISGDGADYMLRLLAEVEGIPLSALQQGVPWDWVSFADYLAAVAQVEPAVNFGAMVGHSALRRLVLGDGCHASEVAPEAMEEMRRQLRVAIDSGAIGFSTSWGEAHFDGQGEPVPSRSARSNELISLCEVLADFPGTQVEFIPTLGPFSDVHVDLMTAMSLAARSPLNWNVLLPIDRETCENKLAASDYAEVRGARVVALAHPGSVQLRSSFVRTGSDGILGWSARLELGPTELSACLADPKERTRLWSLAEAHVGGAIGFEDLRVLDTYTPQAKNLEGRLLGEIATEQGQSVFDVLCELAAQDLRTAFGREPIADSPVAWDQRMHIWRDSRVLIGASDAGAHVDLISTFDVPVAFLALTRERGTLSVAEAVRSLTSLPASLYGFSGIGRIEEGYQADLVLFDPAVVKPGLIRWRDDLPGGGGRLYGEPIGIEHVFVNGTEIVAAGALTGERPGRVLRSGIDTR